MFNSNASLRDVKLQKREKFFPNEPRQCDVIKAMLRFKNRRMETKKKAKNWMLRFFLLHRDVLLTLSALYVPCMGNKFLFNIFLFFQSRRLPQLARFLCVSTIMRASFFLFLGYHLFSLPLLFVLQKNLFLLISFSRIYFV